MDRFEEDAKMVAKNRWNDKHKSYEKNKIMYDDWLDMFEKAIANHSKLITTLLYR